MQALVAHQKQFVLGPQAVRVRPEWEALQLAGRLILSLCEDAARAEGFARAELMATLASFAGLIEARRTKR